MPRFPSLSSSVKLFYIMYTGVVNLNKEKGANVLQILIAADELELLELIKHGQEHIIKNESKGCKKMLLKLWKQFLAMNLLEN
ncbi:hypothetical protein G9A89_017560 [Geosiphon pyriformis]|nr:hypothetical protein G9A89_017560 [Geosiphon pyriformis]